MIIDTHAHYDDEQFDIDREILLSNEEMAKGGIAAIVNASANMEGCRATLELTNKYDNVYGMLGVHPEDVEELTDADYEWIRENCSNPGIVAVGEIGLDYYYEDNPPKEIQTEHFRRFIRLAKEVGLPINVHSREATEETMKIIVEENAKEVGGIIHCFSSSAEVALQYINMGFYIGIGGVVTFKNGKKLKEVVEKCPIESLVLETDCPYLAPTGHRGERNSSYYLPAVVREIADIKGISEEEVLRITENNARKVYGI